jgi:hypothetical protein
VSSPKLDMTIVLRSDLLAQPLQPLQSNGTLAASGDSLITVAFLHASPPRRASNQAVSLAVVSAIIGLAPVLQMLMCIRSRRRCTKADLSRTCHQENSMLSQLDRTSRFLTSCAAFVNERALRLQLEVMKKCNRAQWDRM